MRAAECFLSQVHGPEAEMTSVIFSRIRSRLGAWQFIAQLCRKWIFWWIHGDPLFILSMFVIAGVWHNECIMDLIPRRFLCHKFPLLLFCVRTGVWVWDKPSPFVGGTAEFLQRCTTSLSGKDFWDWLHFWGGGKVSRKTVDAGPVLCNLDVI